MVRNEFMRLKPIVTWKRLAILSLLGIAAMGFTHGVSSTALQRLYGYAVSESGATIEFDVAYGRHTRQRLDIYRPQMGKPTGPIAIFFYGGGWKSGDRGIYRFIGTALASRGITTIIPDYRLFPEVKFPDFVDDAARAYHWVWRNFSENGLNPRPIILIGHSAGAYMAAMISLNPAYLKQTGSDAPRPAGFIGLAGPYAFDPTTWPTTKDIFSNVADPKSAKPVTFASSQSPPSLLFHGLDDEVVRIWNTRSLAKALNESGAETKKIELSGFGHIDPVITLSRPFRWRAPLLSEILSFVNRLKTSHSAGGSRLSSTLER